MAMDQSNCPPWIDPGNSFRLVVNCEPYKAATDYGIVELDEQTRAAYKVGWPNITDRNQWPEVDKGFKLYPPLGKKRAVGRQRKNRILSCLERSGKATRQVTCEGCGQKGHRRGSWRCQLTGTKKRKRTKKNPVKAGRKKAKKDITSEVAQVPKEATTPRTRAVVAKEKAIAAARDAEAALVAAKQAAEVAEAAAREVEGGSRSPVAAVHEPTTSPGPTTRRRLAMETSKPTIVEMTTQHEVCLFEPPKKMTPKKKQLATKVKKASPAKPSKK